MRRAATSAAVVLVAIVLQLTVLDNLRLPLRGAPNLVLVTVVALALTGGPLEGALAGFWAGLALDIAPPATHLVGQYALVLCVVGYACGRAAAHLDELNWAPIGVVALGSAAGELLFALTGIVFGEADVTWTAIRYLLPASVGYDVLLSPFVLYAVTRSRLLATDGLAALRTDPSRAPLTTSALAAAAGLVPVAGAVVRDSGTGGTPRLKARALRAGAGALASGGAPRRPPSRPVRLRLGGGAVMPGGSASGFRIPRTRPAAPVQLRLGSRNWASRYRAAALPGGGGLLGDGAGGRALRPARGPRLRGGVMPGGSARAGRVTVTRPSRPVRLNLGSGRRRDGAIGGSVLGRGLRAGQLTGWSLGSARGLSGSRAFSSGSRSGGLAGGPKPVKRHTPRFRGLRAPAPKPVKRHTPRFRGLRAPAPKPVKRHTPRFRGLQARARKPVQRRSPRFRGLQSRAVASRRLTPRRRSIWRTFGRRTGGLR